jgi:hypothetical protein
VLHAAVRVVAAITAIIRNFRIQISFAVCPIIAALSHKAPQNPRLSQYLPVPGWRAHLRSPVVSDSPRDHRIFRKGERDDCCLSGYFEPSHFALVVRGLSLDQQDGLGCDTGRRGTARTGPG